MSAFVLLVIGACDGRADISPWRKLEAAANAPDPAALQKAGMDHCTHVLITEGKTAVAICRKAGDNERAPLRVFFLSLLDDGVKVISESQGSQDAYSGRLTLFSSPSSPGEILVLADFSAEYCYGTRVFWIEQSRRLREVGAIDDVLDINGEAKCVTEASSVWTDSTGNVEIRVARDVSVPQKNGTYDALGGRSVKYVIERGGSARVTRLVAPK
ncbi:MAG: hypothetical protein QOK44_2453 [Betaproteobacteria bacterium]|jgi:hypothetical protein|nr:hypothetical protein [Betaproteobacteria bacterium]